MSHTLCFSYPENWITYWTTGLEFEKDNPGQKSGTSRCTPNMYIGEECMFNILWLFYSVETLYIWIFYQFTTLEYSGSYTILKKVKNLCIPILSSNIMPAYDVAWCQNTNPLPTSCHLDTWEKMSEILHKVWIVIWKSKYLNMMSTKWWPFSSSLNVLRGHDIDLEALVYFWYLAIKMSHTWPQPIFNNVW